VAVAGLAAAFVSGCVVAIIAIVITAGGHGWTAAMISATAVLTAPAGAAAWSVRHGRHGRTVAAIVTTINAIIDLTLAVLTWREGFAYVANTFEHLAPLIVAWAVLWLSWQAVPLIALMRTAARPSVVASP